MSSRGTTTWIAITAGIALALYAAFVFFLWIAQKRDISRFIVLSATTVDTKNVPPGVAVSPDIAGYDGTAFYRLALDPFTHRLTAFGITLDAPAYRQQRILYPFLVWLCSLGRASLVPWALVLVNLAAIAALAAAGAQLSVAVGRHPLAGLAFALYPGFVYSVSRDLCEPTACAAGLGAMVAIAKRRYTLAAALLSAAVLARETLLLLAIACCAAYLWSRLRRRTPEYPLVLFAVPLAVYAAWELILRRVWGITPLLSGPRSFTPPFTQYWHALGIASSLRHEHRLVFCELAYLAIITLLAVVAIRSRNVPEFWKLGALCYLALAATMPAEVWADDAAYMRVLGDYSMVSMAAILSSSRSGSWILCLATGTTWYYLASHLIKYT